MTPYQGDSPNQPGGRQPSGNEYQQPPAGQPQQPPTGQFQGQPMQGRQGGQRGQQSHQGQPQPMQGNPQSMPPGQPPQAPPQQGSTGNPPQMPTGGAQPQPPSSSRIQPPGNAQPPVQQGQPGGGRGGRRDRPLLRPIRIEEIVQTDVVTAQRDTPVATVVAKMAEKDVGCVVVVEDDRPVGVITDRQIALALENTPDVADKQAGDLIGGDLVTATTSMSVFDALQQLNDETIRRLPIVDEDGSLQGIVTLDDLLVLLGSELNKAGETIQAQSPRL